MPVSSQLFTARLLITMLSALVGTAAGLQFAAVFQLVLIPPIQYTMGEREVNSAFVSGTEPVASDTGDVVEIVGALMVVGNTTHPDPSQLAKIELAASPRSIRR